MPSPSHSMRIPAKNVKPVKPKEREKKTIFGHVSDAMGVHLQKQVKGTVSYMEMIKNLILSLSVFLAIGFVVGLITDIFLKTGYLAQVGALMMLLFWIYRKGRRYLSDKL